ncbi:unnamed protein product, partial [Taenia asiatica]|uniref:Uncharacterized protein n=1 Tax=Taenia asiatica TaxID=60517 RepID=A0A0R3VZP0_TAEAS
MLVKPMVYQGVLANSRVPYSGSNLSDGISFSHSTLNLANMPLEADLVIKNGDDFEPSVLFTPQSLPFVLVPRSQVSLETNQESADEEDEMEQALRASLSCTTWIAQAPPIHFELIPVDAPAVPTT